MSWMNETLEVELKLQGNVTYLIDNSFNLKWFHSILNPLTVNKVKAHKLLQRTRWFYYYFCHNRSTAKAQRAA